MRAAAGGNVSFLVLIVVVTRNDQSSKPSIAGIEVIEIQTVEVNCLRVEGVDYRLRGNDGGAVSIFSDKFLKLKISSFPQEQKTKNRNLKSRHSPVDHKLHLEVQTVNPNSLNTVYIETEKGGRPEAKTLCTS
ncbi:hypothetical protein M5Z40_11335 [Neisseria meningitidis]|nr:hypothetical protein [Neisseria meningitidis]